MQEQPDLLSEQNLSDPFHINAKEFKALALRIRVEHLEFALLLAH